MYSSPRSAERGGPPKSLSEERGGASNTRTFRTDGGNAGEDAENDGDNENNHQRRNEVIHSNLQHLRVVDTTVRRTVSYPNLQPLSYIAY